MEAEIAGITYMDFRKAFGRVSHHLLVKMEI